MSLNSLNNKLTPILIILISVILSVAISKFVLVNSGSNNQLVDKKQLNDNIEEYIRNNADKVLESVNNYYAELEKNKNKNRNNVLKEESKNVFDLNDPYIGPKDAKSVVVEFFDYNCGYCKRALKTINKIVDQKPDVKVIFKEFPILGESSVLKSKASIASYLISPKKYMDVHATLMSSGRVVNSGQAADLILKHGFNRDTLVKKMESDEVNKIIERNRNLAMKLSVNGTPAFIVNDQILDGAVPFEKIKNIIEKNNK